LEADKSSRKYAVKGGNTILGRVFAYQERTGAAIKDIMSMPYIQFVIGMADAPQIDYETKDKKEKDEIYIPKNAQEESKSLRGFLGI